MGRRSPPRGGGVDRNFLFDYVCCNRMTSPLAQGRGSKLFQRYGNDEDTVAPARGRGSKRRPQALVVNVVRVAPRTGGVDRNIGTPKGRNEFHKSPPVRERGSKH